LLLWGGFGLGEEAGLPVGFLDAAAGYVEVARLDLDADELAAKVHAGNSGGAAAHERVEDGFSLRQKPKAPHHQRHRLLCWVFPLQSNGVVREVAPAIDP